MGKGAAFFFQAEDGIRDSSVTGVQTCALPISAFSTVFLGGGKRSVRPFLSVNTAAARATTTVARFLHFSGKDSTMPSLRPSQNCATGQSRHCGDFGVQSFAPSSTMA